MLKIKKLNSGYGKLHVLSNISLDLDSFGLVSIIGPNGAGKSTLLKSIFNLCDIYSGSIVFNNENIEKMDTHKLIQNGLGFVPQGRINFPELSVEENLLIGNYSVSDKEIVEQNLKRVYSFFPELSKHKNRLAYVLSGGQQQMLGIGRALMFSPKLLLLDEPSLGLSPKLIEEIFSKIKKISKDCLVLMVEQNAKKAMEYSDLTIVLEQGKIALKGESKKLLKNSKVKKIFLGSN